MNVLYISYDGMTDPLGQSQVVPYLMGLSKKGFQVFLLSFEKPKRYLRDANKITEMLASGNIIWKPLPYTSSPAVFSTLKDIRRAKKEALRIIVKNEIRLIHCRSYIAALVGLEMKRKKNIPFLFDMRGFWADERVEGGLWNLKKPLYRKIYKYFKAKEKRFLSESAHIISLTEAGKTEILSMGLDNVGVNKITVIPCCTDTRMFRPLLMDVTLKRLQEDLNIGKNALVIAYVGSLGTWYMAKEMFDFFYMLHEKRKEAVFLIISTDDPFEIRALAVSRGIDPGSLFIKAASREEVPGLLALCKATLFFIRPVFSKKASSPTKMGESLCSGIPVICNDGIGDCTSIINDTQSGVIVRDFTEAAYDEAIRQLDRIFTTDYGNIRNNALKYFDLAAGISKYETVYHTCLHQ